jgi:hypothetical protein
MENPWRRYRVFARSLVSLTSKKTSLLLAVSQTQGWFRLGGKSIPIVLIEGNNPCYHHRLLLKKNAMVKTTSRQHTNMP